jgi:hypothetical protein
MEQVQPKLTVGDVFGYALAYMCWLVTAAIAMLAVFQTRNMINVMWPVLGGNQWVLRAIDRFGLLFLGLVWLVFVIFVEQHFRTAITYVRERRHKAEHEPAAGPRRPAAPRPYGRFMRFLYRLGLDMLAMRFVPTLMMPLAWFVVAYLLQQLAFILIGQI